MLIQGVLACSVPCKSRDWNSNLISNGREDCFRNFLYFHQSATWKMQESKLDRKAKTIRRTPTTMNQVQFFLSEGVIPGDFTI